MPLSRQMGGFKIILTQWLYFEPAITNVDSGIYDCQTYEQRLKQPYIMAGQFIFERTESGKMLLSFHEGFDFVRSTDDGFREAFASVFCDQKIVFNTDTNLPFVDVEPRLVCNDRTRF